MISVGVECLKAGNPR